MKNLEIILKDKKVDYLPAESVSGKVRWHFETESPGNLHLKFYWQTSGRSQADTEIVNMLTIQTPELSGSQDFEFKFPYGPPSYEGRLFSLNWFLEVFSDVKGVPTEVVELEMCRIST